MDQANARRGAIERAREVTGVVAQMIEDREVLTEPARDSAAALPVAPVAPDVALEALVASRVERRGPEQHPPQRVLRVAQHQLARHPSLVVAQVAEALVVEVVDQTELANRLDVGAQDVHFARSDRAHGDLERVAPAVQTGQRLVGEARGLDPQAGFVHVHAAVLPRQAHELGRDTLAVLEAAELDVTCLDTRLLGEEAHDLGGRHLLLGHAVDGEVAALLDVVFVQEFADVEVPDALFESHFL